MYFAKQMLIDIRGVGRNLAVGLSDGAVKIVDIWLRKVLAQSNDPKHSNHVSRSTPSSETQFVSLAWGRSPLSVPRQTIERQTQSLSDESIEEASDAPGISADYVRDMAMLDIENSLPKLSTLPAEVEDPSLSTRSGIDATFHNLRMPQYRHLLPKDQSGNPGSKNGQNEADAMGILLASSERGDVQMWVFDAFDVGVIELAQALPSSLQREVRLGKATTSIVSCAFHPHRPSQTLIVAIKAGAGADTDPSATSPTQRKESSLHLFTLDCTFLGTSSYNTLSPNAKASSRTLSMSTNTYAISIITTKLSQLKLLSKYVNRIRSVIARDVNAGFELPSKWLQNAYDSFAPSIAQNTTLREGYAWKPDVRQVEDEWGRQLFQSHMTRLLATGECDSKLREWLVDELGDRGLKRWEKAVNDGLESARRGLEECLLPASERLLVVLSRLTGLAGSTETSTRLPRTSRQANLGLELDSKALRTLTEVTRCLIILANEILKSVCAEIVAFRKWIQWMKWCCEVEGCETDERREEVREGGAEAIDWLSVLEYSKTGLRGGDLPKLLGRPTSQQDDSIAKTAVKWDCPNLYEEFKKARQNARPTPDLQVCTYLMERDANTVYTGVVATLNRSILVKYEGQLPDDVDSQKPLEITLFPSPARNNIAGTLVAANRPRLASPTIQDSIRRYSLLVGNDRSIQLQGVDSGPTSHTTGRTRRQSSLNMTEDSLERVLDVKILGDRRVIVLLDAQGERHLLSQKLNKDDVQGNAGWDHVHVFQRDQKPYLISASVTRGRDIIALLDESDRRYEIFELQDS